jgi:hypothetical protein
MGWRQRWDPARLVRGHAVSKGNLGAGRRTPRPQNSQGQGWTLRGKSFGSTFRAITPGHPGGVTATHGRSKKWDARHRRDKAAGQRRSDLRMCGGQGRGRTADLLIFSRSFRISFRIRFTAWFQAAAHCRFAAPWMRRPSQQRPNEPGCGRDSMRLAYSLSARSEQPQLGRCRRPWDTYYRAGRNRCDGRPTVPEDRVPVPCRWGSVARRKVSFCRVVPATVSWIWCSSRRVNRGPRRWSGSGGRHIVAVVLVWRRLRWRRGRRAAAQSGIRGPAAPV